ncbi:MAG: bifunctional DNA primase/polymerase [Nitrososphaerota archaeon]
MRLGMLSASDPLELYISRGLTPIPLEAGGKRPILENWPNVSREETLRVFESSMNCNLGIKLEPPLFVIDIDDKRLPPLILDEVTSPTWVVETRRGIHIYLKAPEGHYPTTNKKSRLIQLLAEKCQVVAPPSIVEGHIYRFLYDPHKTPIAEVSSEKLKLLERIVETFAKHEGLILKFAELWTEGHRHNLSLWLNGALRKSGIERFEAAVIVKSICLLAGDLELKDRLTALKTTYERPIEEIGAWSYLKRELESIVGPERSNEILKTLPVKIEEEIRREHEAAEKPRARYVLGGEVLGDGRVIEIAENDGALKLLVYDPSANALEICDSLRIENVEYRPYADLPFKEYLPGIPEAISEDPELWRGTLDFIREYYDNPKSDDVYHVMAAVVAWSYFCDLVKGSTPYLCFLGPFRSGKTRALEVMAALCYKPMLIVDPSEASLFRIIEKFKPTLFIDEAQILEKNIRAILASGYRYGMRVPRVIDPETDGLEGIKWFDCFGLKVYACREEPPNDILSRSIVIHCEKNVRQLRKKIDSEKAKELRTRWLAQKLRMFNKVTVTFEEFQSEDGRLQELFSPLIVIAQLFGDQEAAAAIERYGRQIEREIFSMEATSDDALIVVKILEIISERSNDAPEVLTNKEIVEKLNNEYPDGFSPEYVGKRLVALGFERTRLHGGKVAYKIDYELLERLAKRYNINFSINMTLGVVNGEGCTLFG